MPDNAIEFIDEVSNSPLAIGKNQLLTAEAVEGKIPAAPQVTTFTNADLVGGKLLKSYISGQAIVFYSMKDELNQDIKVPAVYDGAGTYVEFDFSGLEDPGDLGNFITGTWTLAIWTASGPIGVPAGPTQPGDSNTGRVRLEPPAGDIDLKVATTHTIFTVEAGTLLALEELEITLVDVFNATQQASISLEIIAGDTIIASQPIPIDALYERYAIDISTSNVLPAGSVIQLTVTNPGIAVGNMLARAYLFAYVDEV